MPKLLIQLKFYIVLFSFWGTWFILFFGSQSLNIAAQIDLEKVLSYRSKSFVFMLLFCLQLKVNTEKMCAVGPHANSSDTTFPQKDTILEVQTRITKNIRWLLHKMPKSHLKIQRALVFHIFFISTCNSDEPDMCAKKICENIVNLWCATILHEIYPSLTCQLSTTNSDISSCPFQVDMTLFAHKHNTYITLFLHSSIHIRNAFWTDSWLKS